MKNNFIQTLQHVYISNQQYVQQELVGENFINKVYAENNLSYTLPGNSLYFIINVDTLSYEIFNNTGVDYKNPIDAKHLDLLFNDLNDFLIEEDKQTYINAIDCLFKQHLGYFNKAREFHFRSSFLFRIQKDDKRITTYLQNNIPIEIKDGKIVRFFSTVTDITHTNLEQKHQLSLYNMNSNEIVYFDLRSGTPKNSSDLQLSNREKEILQCVLKGLNTKETAEQLDISIETVNRHRKNMIKKNNKKNIIHLATDAFKKNLL